MTDVYYNFKPIKNISPTLIRSLLANGGRLENRRVCLSVRFLYLISSIIDVHMFC